jgi:hypothetical protein
MEGAGRDGEGERSRCRLEGQVNRRFKNNDRFSLKEYGIKIMFIFKHKIKIS